MAEAFPGSGREPTGQVSAWYDRFLACLPYAELQTEWMHLGVPCIKNGVPMQVPRFQSVEYSVLSYKFTLRLKANPTRPAPNRNRVEGSGTASGLCDSQDQIP
jgi:hypothetical protein